MVNDYNNVFGDYGIGKRYEVVLQNGKTKQVKDSQELMKYAYNPSNPVPEMIGNYTHLSNYVATFWMPLMGVGGFSAYVQITKMAYGNKNNSYPSQGYLAMMMGTDVKTVRKYLKILQELNFVVVVHVFDEKTGTQKNNLYMLANTIPFLTDTELEKLPSRLQEEHKAFVEGIKRRTILE